MTFALCACMGGTATDTENGINISARVVTSANAPVANVKIQVLDLDASAASPTLSPLKDSNAVMTTDATGRVTISLKSAGKFIAQGRRGDSILFADTLRVVKKNPDGVVNPGMGDPQFVAENPVKAEGKIRLLSGFNADSGQVLIQGTRLESKLSNTGTYKLGWLPPSMEKLKLTAAYGARPSNKRFVKVVDKGAAGWQLLLSVSANGRCMTDSTATHLSTASSGTGSLDSVAVVARIAGLGCKGSTGSQVRVYKTDASGVILQNLGDFVVVDTAAHIPQDAAVPVGCIRSGVSGSSPAALKLNAGQIVVDDISRTGGICPAK